MPYNTEHCLRRDLCEAILYDFLEQDQNRFMNVWGDEDGDGKRLLRDIEKCNLENVICINLSFRNYRHSLAALLDAIYEQGVGKGQKHSQDSHDLRAVLQSIKSRWGNEDKNIILMLADIDPLYESAGNDSLYNDDFVYSLNQFNDKAEGCYILFTSKSNL